MFSKVLRTASVSVLALACMLVGSSTYAQETDGEDFNRRMSEAAATAKKDLNDALVQYLEIRTKYANESIDYSLGRIYQRLGQCENAQASFSSVLSSYNLDDMNPIFQRTIKDFDDLNDCAKWQKIYLDCTTIPDAYITIDNDRIGACPSRPISLPDGDHTIKIIAPDGREGVENIKTGSGKMDKKVPLALPPEKVLPKIATIEKKVEVAHNFVEKHKFHPALYWGLIAGGVAIMGTGGIFGVIAQKAHGDEIKYNEKTSIIQSNLDHKENFIAADNQAVEDYFNGLNNEFQDLRDKAEDAKNKASLNKTLSLTMVGIGAAVTVTGVALAIVDIVSEKTLVEVENKDAPKAFFAPSPEGFSMGVAMTF